MKRLSVFGGLAALAGLLLLAGAARAQVSPSWDLSWHALSGGGSRAASASYAMESTLGQGLAGRLNGPGTQVLAGYWQKWLVAGPYLPLLMRQ